METTQIPSGELSQQFPASLGLDGVVSSPPLFEFTPKWLESYIKENPSVLGTLQDISAKRTAEAKVDLPWTVYLESISLGRGFSIQKVVAGIARFHHFQVVPVNIGLIEPKDYSDSFPVELMDRFHAAPIGLNDTFINIALLEPEVGRELSDAYYHWLGVRRPKALQFFITWPSALMNYRMIFDRLLARRVGGVE